MDSRGPADLLARPQKREDVGRPLGLVSRSVSDTSEKPNVHFHEPAGPLKTTLRMAEDRAAPWHFKRCFRDTGEKPGAHSRKLVDFSGHF